MALARPTHDFNYNPTESRLDKINRLAQESSVANFRISSRNKELTLKLIELLSDNLELSGHGCNEETFVSYEGHFDNNE